MTQFRQMNSDQLSRAPRRKRYDIPGHARFLTFSCHQRLPLFQNDAIKDAFVEHLAAIRLKARFEVWAYVVMPEHVHLLIRPDPSDPSVEKILNAIKRPFARRVLGRWSQLRAPILERITTERGSRHFWMRGGGYDRNVFAIDELREKVDYIHKNPVTRGLVERPDAYRWSSAAWYAGEREVVIEVDAIDW